MNALSEGHSRQPPRLTGSATGVPPPPPGVQPPPLWGNESHFRVLFGNGITAASFERSRLTTPPQITTPIELREFFKANYGPTIAVYNSLVDCQMRAPRRITTSSGSSQTDARIPSAPIAVAQWEREYLLFTARKA